MFTRSSPHPTGPRFALTVAGVAIAFLAVACGETGEPPTAVPAPSTVEPTLTTTTETAAPPASAAAPVIDATGSVDAAPSTVPPSTVPPSGVSTTTGTSPSGPGDHTAAEALAALDALDELLAAMTGQVDGVGCDLAADAAAQTAG